MMNGLYVLGGFVCLIFGAYQTVITIKIFKAGKQDEFGWDIKGLGAYVGFIIIGVYLICEYI
ncbi:MAG: hypothetical protein NVSMB24_30730 [Mucilaginibacter sp.]